MFLNRMWWIPKFTFGLGFAEGDGGGGEGDGSAGDLAAAKAELAGLKAQLEQTAKAKGEMEAKLRDADSELLGDEYLDYLEQKGKNKGGKKPASSTTSEEEVDWETMSKAQIVKHLTEKHSGDLKKAQEDLVSQVGKLSDKVAVAFARVDIELARHKFPDFDFDKNKERFYQLSKENEKWGAQRVVKEILREDKEKSDVEAKEKEEAAEKERKALTERGGLPIGSGQEKRLTKEQAAELAYRKAFGNDKG